MKKFGKGLTVVIAILLVLSLVLAVGCGDDAVKDTTTKKAEETTAVPETTKEPLKEVTLKWVTALPSVDTDRDLVFEEFNKVVKEKINATVEFDIIEFGQWLTKIPVLLSSGEDMDIVWHNWQFSYASNVQKGLYLPIDDLLAEYGQTLLNEIPSALFDIFRVEGKIYGIPCYQISTNGNAYLVKKDVLDKTGFDLSTVKTYKDLGPLLEKIKETSPELLYPMQNRSGLIWEMSRLERGWETVIAGSGSPLSVDWADDTKTVFNMFGTPEYKEYLDIVHDWYNKGYIREDVASVTNVTAEEAEGQYGVMVGGTVKYPGAQAAEKAAKEGYDVAEVITGQNYWQYTAAQATLLAIPRQSENPERAIMLIDLMTADADLANILAYGIENKHYTRVGETQVERIPETGYDFNWQWSMLNTFKLYLPTSVPADQNARIQATHDSAIGSQLAGFIPNPDEYLTLLSQCQTAWNEMGLGLQTGVLDPEVYLPQFLETLDKAGINELVEIVQGQIDAQLK